MRKQPEGPRPASRLATARRAVAAYRRLTPFFSGSRNRTLLLVALSVVAGLVEAVLLALIATAATALSQGRDAVMVDVPGPDWEVPVDAALVLGVVLALVRGGLHVVLAYLPAAMSAHAMAALRRRLFDAFTTSAWSVKASERDGQFQSLMNAHITSTAQAVITLATGVTAVMMFGTLLVSAVLLSPLAAAILMVMSVGLFLALRPLARRLRRHSARLSKENIEYSKGVQEVVLMAEETEVFGAGDTYRRAFYAQIEEVRAPLLRTRFLAGAVPALYQSVALLVLVLALAAVSFLEPARLATLGAVVLMLVRALTYGQQMQTAVTAMDERIPFMQRLADAIDRYEGAPQQDGPQPLGRIESFGMDRVHFSYTGETDVLRGISFSLERGEALGVVGPSGAGKSSIVQLLLRLREPDRGSVLVNGSDVRGTRRDDWRRRVAYVPQTPQLVWGTVTDNIRFYRPEITQEDVERAARLAHVHDEIMAWPDGYATVIGQRAAAVSGGQRQRLCLARALAARPDVIILDEPTSALDVKSEELVQESLRGLKGTLILVLVAHRLSTLVDCDRVMVVVDGRLDALDEPAALLEHNAFFREVTEITRRQSG